MSDAATADEVQRARDAADAMYADDLASQSLGIAIEDIAPGQATARMRITRTMVNGHAIAHGGYIFLLADSAFAFACNTRGPHVAGAAEIVFAQPVREGDELVATATERVRFGESGIYDVTIRRGNDVVAEFRGHSRRLRGRTE